MTQKIKMNSDQTVEITADLKKADGTAYADPMPVSHWVLDQRGSPKGELTVAPDKLSAVFDPKGYGGWALVSYRAGEKFETVELEIVQAEDVADVVLTVVVT